MNFRWMVLLTVIALSLFACAPAKPAEEDLPLEPQSPPEQELSTPSPENPLEPESTPEASDMPTDAPPVEKFVDLARKDLVERLNVDPASINLAQSEAIVWPDAALGCPEPGKVYAQVRVPGFRIWLEAGGLAYDYHTDWLGQVILCPDPGLDLDASFPTNTGPTPQIGVPRK